MEKFGLALLLSLLGIATICFISVSGVNECQCGGYIVNEAEGYSEWFYTFPVYFTDSCDDEEACRDWCYDLASNFTNGGDLTYVVTEDGDTVGDLACAQLVHDVYPGAKIEFEYQLCVGAWNDSLLVTSPEFCCYNGDYPENEC